MYFSLISVVLGSTIIVFFLDEFSRTIKSINRLPGVKVFAPLIITSWILIYFEQWAAWLLFYLHRLLDTGINFLEDVISFLPASKQLSQILIFFLIGILPVTLFGWLYKKRKHQPYDYIQIVFITVFIFILMIMLAAQ